MNEPASPRSVGAFAILRELGRGGMGVVYEAVEAETGRRVALKVVSGGPFVDDGALRLFRREIQALARLEHPGIASLYASGRTSDGFHYFAMELVDGLPLDAWLRERRAAITTGELRARLALFLEIADAVAYAHRRGVLHRDIKPSNLVVTPDGHVKVLDFGLARITDADVTRATMATELGAVRGTLAYMSPEQLTGRPEGVDARADVYALGVVLYEMLVGEHPFDLETIPAFDIPRVIREDRPKSLRTLWKGQRRLDPDLSTIVAKALEKDPGRRYQAASALADDLRRHLAGQPILARAPSAVYQLRKLVARHKVPFAALAIVVALLAAFGVSMAVFARHLADERNRANREAQRASDEARTAQQAAKVLSEVVRVELSGGLFESRTLDPAEVARVVASIEARWPNRPQAAAELLESVGSSMVWANAYETSIRFLERAVEIRRDILHDPDWEIDGRRIPLGEYYVIVGRLRDAEAIFSTALARARAKPGVESNTIGYLLEDLGCVRRDLGRYAEAEALLREALVAYEAQRPVWLPYVGSVHDSLGTTHLARGELEAAETEMRESLRLRESYSKDLNWARGCHMLGLVLVRRGKLAEAEPLLDDALAHRMRAWGPDSAEAATIFDAFAELRLAQGRLDLADEALRRSLGAFDKTLPPGVPARATALVHLAELRRRQGRPADARDALLQAVSIREAALGADHPDTIRARALLAAL